MTTPAATGIAEEDARQRRLLDAGLATFMRYGYRKASMDEVARAAHLSRQAIYLHFPNKEALFRAVVRYAVEGSLALAAETTRDPDVPIEDRLVGAFDAWVGRYLDIVGDNITDLHEATAVIGGEVIADAEERFVELVTRLIRGSALPAAYRAGGITARQLAEILQATARGLKQASTSRAQFVERFRIAVRALCLAARG
jgi:TetR/AcrR family transcriptional regulator, regulator of autoinduction and epiphytic fitness